ncbi:MAG: four helix bundle protein [Chloroflexota bacterium]
MERAGETQGPISITERSIAYSVRMIQLYRELSSDSAGRVIARQLLRSATSVGANVHEAQAGQSKADFIAKMSIAHKEATESRYWLRVIAEAQLIQDKKLVGLRDETEQIIRILGKILVTARGRNRRTTYTESEASNEI